MKKNVIFDFDGVILNSHKVKSNAFYFVFKKFGNLTANKAKNFHTKNIGKTRYYKFDYIKKNFNFEKNIISTKELDIQFDQYVLKEILKLKISKYLTNFLELNKKYNFYISTSTPKKKIINILKRKKIFKYFDKIYGSPDSKYTHVKLIKKNKKETIFIGDSAEDLNVAKKMKISFLLKNNSENKFLRKYEKNLIKINSFKNIEKKIDTILTNK